MTPQQVSKNQRKKQKKQVMEEEVDFLEVDKPIPGQNFVCMSFLSPESAVKERYLWYLKEFLNDLVKPIPQPDGMSEMEYKTKLHSILMHKFTYKSISDIWEDFLYSNKEDLNKKYDEEVDFQTSTRGLKLRGVYDTYREAKRRSDQIARFDKKHNVYIGQMGYWLPWDPDPHEVQEQEYQEKELNTLMKKYQENLINKEEFFHARNREKMEASLRENKNAKRASTEDKKELEKVRKTVSEKDKLLNQALEEQRKKKKEQKVVEEEEKHVKEEEKKEEKDNSDTSEDDNVKVVPEKKEYVKPTERIEHTSDFKQSTVTKETVSSVFETDDPWLQRKKERLESVEDVEEVEEVGGNTSV